MRFLERLGTGLPKQVFVYRSGQLEEVWVLDAGITYYLYCRWPSLLEGKATPADVIIFFVWIIVALLPLIVEINFFGIRLKKHIDELRSEVKEEVATLRAEFQNTNINKNQLSQNLVLGSPPPPDNQLKELEHRLTQIVERALSTVGGSQQNQVTEIPTVDDRVTLLFSARYQIEKELRRIWSTRLQGDQNRRILSITAIISALVQAELLPSDFGHAIREVYSVCSPAIHGEEISDEKIHFVRDLAPNMIATLKEIK